MLQTRAVRPGSPGWLTTFADLAALLLSFFVLTYAMGTIREGELRSMSAGFVARTEVGDRKDQDFVAAERTVHRDAADTLPSAEYAAALLQARLTASGIANGYSIGSAGNAVTVTFDRGMLDSDGKGWSAAGLGAAERVAEWAGQEDARLAISLARLDGEDAVSGLARGWRLIDAMTQSGVRVPVRLFSVAPVSDISAPPLGIVINLHGAG